MDRFSSGSLNAYESEMYGSNWTFLSKTSYAGDGPAASNVNSLLAEFHVSPTAPPTSDFVVEHHLLTSPVVGDLFSGWALT